VKVLSVALVALALVAPARAAERVGWTPNDPLLARQYYVAQDRAFEAWNQAPLLAPVLVGIVDSGIDGGHPEFTGRIAAARSFVGGSALTDEQGHGTFVAGLIAAGTDNGLGIAGIAPSARLVIAKAARPDGTFSPATEAAAIRWAADRGARVINLSFGGLRAPRQLSIDSFAAVEASAVDYAVRKGALVVAAVGNADEGPSSPWPYASYPSALPHVVGVSALTESGAVPTFSNRDAVFNDLAAPGDGILSTFPRQLTRVERGCLDQGYSDCGGPDWAEAGGTSFAAAQVSAAAAVLFGVNPTLSADQVGRILERSTDDVSPSTGCSRCTYGRDVLSGWGRLDVFRAVSALAEALPPRDAREPNDEAGKHAASLTGPSARVRATLDYWDDPVDVYRVYLRQGQRVTIGIAGTPGTRTLLALMRPGTTRIANASPRLRLAQSAKPGSVQTLTYRTTTSGWYFAAASLTAAGSGAYTLTINKR
jgi:subtilisin family serine protease